MREIKSIQYLRGLAAVSVLFFHMSERFTGPFMPGAAGVDVFFVISGFVMWITSAGRRLTPEQFMARRIVRIVPLYWIVTVVTAAAILLKPRFMYGHEVDGSNFIRSLFFEPRLKDGAFFPVVIQGWTLTYEMFFYVVFAAALIAPEGRRLYIVSGVLGVLCVLCLLYPVASGYARALGNPIILEFLGGMLLGKLWMSDLKPPLWLGLAILLTGFILLGISESLMPELPRFVRWGGPALMIVAGGIFSERAYSSLSLYPLKIIGDASYSIYLWHVVVVSFLDGVLLRFKLNTILHIALIGILTVAITTLLYFVLEKPIINLLRASKSREVPI